MIVAAGLEIFVTSIAKGFADVAFTGSLLVTFLMVGVVVWYSKRRPVGTPLTWGEAMVASIFVTFACFWAFGVVPHQWLSYAEGPLAMRADAILAGPGSTGIAQWSPIVITKATVSDLVCVHLYVFAFSGTIAMWAVWQGRGDKVPESVERSPYGRPLVRS